LAPHFNLKITISPTIVEKREYMTRVSHASAVGSLMYAIVCTRYDLSQDVSMVSRYSTIPVGVNLVAVKWILQYIKDILDVGLVFEKDLTGK